MAPPRRRPGPNWGTVVTKDIASSQRPPHLGPGLRRGGARDAVCTMLFVDIVPAARKEMAPPRRGPGPSWETVVTNDSAPSLRPSHLGPGLRRGGERDAACTMLIVDIVPAARKEMAPPRRRPGPSWGTVVMKGCTSSRQPPQLDPGLRRGGHVWGETQELVPRPTKAPHRPNAPPPHRTNPGTPIQPRRHVRCSLRYCPPPAATP